MGETLRFDLSAYRSTVTREMLQVRVRMTPIAFGVGSEPVAANVTDDGSGLEVDAAALMAANAEVRTRLAAGPEGAIVLMRRMATARAALDRFASSGGPFGPYVEAAAHYQALGALKFCLPDIGQPPALLAPDGPTLWSIVRRSELALAALRLRGGERYRQRLDRHRREFGYLYAEDVDFREHESLAALDARIAAITAVAAERRQLSAALAEDRMRKAHARRAFAETGPSAHLVSHVLLARALAEHEDLNRRAKMRFLRDVRDLADRTGLDIERDSLAAFAAARPDATVLVRTGSEGT